MAIHDKTRKIIEAAADVLREYHPMTVRQVYYQLVSIQLIDNNRSEYQGVSKALVRARQEGLIPWEWIEDRLRKPRTVGMWEDLSDFADTVVKAYRRDVWESQQNYFEAWLEKDALSGVFEDILRGYGVTLNVGRGFDGWDSIRNAAERFGDGQEKTILYFGDFDPSGEDMARSLSERLSFFGCEPEIIKCALTFDDIARHNLPPDFAKKSDTRYEKFVAKHGDVSVELDALPMNVLQTRLRAEVESRLDMDALAEVKKIEKRERENLRQVMESMA